MKQYLKIIQHGDALTAVQAETALDQLISGKADSIQAGAFLMGLATRGETKDEIVGMLTSMRNHMVTITLGETVVDTCGTGGDGKNTFNISTAAALVCAALGVPIAKHGNRAASSKSGSADILEALDIPIDLKGKAAEKYFSKHNFVFLNARLFHPAMKHLALVRQAIGVPTIMNYLGPLANPAGAKHQLIGVADPMKADVLGQALMDLGSEHVIIVYSDDGLDEASIAAPTSVIEFTPNDMKRYRIEPRKEYGLEEISGGTPQQNAQMMKQLANGDGSSAMIEAVAMNAGLALLAAEKADSYEAGKMMAETLLRGNKLSDYLNTL